MRVEGGDWGVQEVVRCDRGARLGDREIFGRLLAQQVDDLPFLKGEKRVETW